MPLAPSLILAAPRHGEAPGRCSTPCPAAARAQPGTPQDKSPTRLLAIPRTQTSAVHEQVALVASRGEAFASTTHLPGHRTPLLRSLLSNLSLLPSKATTRRLKSKTCNPTLPHKQACGHAGTPSQGCADTPAAPTSPSHPKLTPSCRSFL